MSLAKMSVARPTTIFIVFVLLIFLGVFAFINLPIDLYPEVEIPYILVMTTYEGAGPEEVERSVSRIMEARLSNVSGLDKIRSNSSKGVSTVILEFSYGTDLVDAANSVRDNLEIAKRLIPDEADAPMIFRFDPAMMPIMGLMVMGNRSPEELREIAEDNILPRIEQTPG
ncbi:MAG: efflux RND transporter permease subunit, partial [Treponema sp.]|nr:efflux RND transporter permease subunit [Treponema sp.]